jgi:CO/xanthine dehydrogenase Mo-binding subunit
MLKGAAYSMTARQRFELTHPGQVVDVQQALGKHRAVEVNGRKDIFSFSAVFAEVRIYPDFGLVRLNRVVGSYDAGRIINPKTARSQAIGGIIWGVG